ncbi:neuromedin-S [Lycodopsis pacificus]
MSLPSERQLFLLCLFWFLGSWSTTDAAPLDRWGDEIEFRKERVQNVFKRFLFHYSKARNSVGAVQHQSHSVHPLMRLSPKLSQRRHKVLLLRIRGLPEGSL